MEERVNKGDRKSMRCVCEGEIMGEMIDIIWPTS